MRTTNVMRVALFTDAYHEASGNARTVRALEAFAVERHRPLLVVHAGRATQLVEDGSIVRLELGRWGPTSFAFGDGQPFDVALWRHARRVAKVVRWFRPDVLHVTGQGDVGRLGAFLGHRLNVPTVGSSSGFPPASRTSADQAAAAVDCAAVYHAYDAAIAGVARGRRGAERPLVAVTEKQSA